MAAISIVIFAEDPARAATWVTRITGTSYAEVVEVSSELDDLVSLVKDQQPQALLADLGERPSEVIEALGKLSQPRPTLLLAGPQSDAQLVLQAIRLGVREYFAADATDGELSRVFGALNAEFNKTEGARVEAPMVAVMGAKGGVGATFVATQLAAALQGDARDSVLVDLNLRLGDAATYLDIKPNFTISQIAVNPERVDATALRSMLQRHSSGLRLLAAPTAVEEADRIESVHLERAIRLLRRDFEWIIADVARDWTTPSISALDLADLVVLVTQLDVPTLNHTRLHMEVLKRLGHADEKIVILANRFEKSSAVGAGDCASFLGRSPDFFVPNDYRSVSTAINQGKLLGELGGARGLQKAFGKVAIGLRLRLGGEAAIDSGGLLGRIGQLIGKKRHGTA